MRLLDLPNTGRSHPTYASLPKCSNKMVTSSLIIKISSRNASAHDLPSAGRRGSAKSQARDLRRENGNDDNQRTQAGNEADR